MCNFKYPEKNTKAELEEYFIKESKREGERERERIQKE
jgi:hypothetical protein